MKNRLLILWIGWSCSWTRLAEGIIGIVTLGWLTPHLALAVCQFFSKRLKKKVFVTDDSPVLEKGKLDPTDEAILEEAKRGQGIAIESSEQFMALAKGLRDTFDHCLEFCRQNMTKDQAEQVRKLRFDGYSWRAVARACHDLKWWGQNEYWDSVPSAQPMGMALCQVAAQFFNENYREKPWN